LQDSVNAHGNEKEERMQAQNLCSEDSSRKAGVQAGKNDAAMPVPNHTFLWRERYYLGFVMALI
jgi:hypothetical protein